MHVVVLESMVGCGVGDTETLPEGTAAPVKVGGLRLTEAGSVALDDSAMEALRASPSPTASPELPLQVHAKVRRAKVHEHQLRLPAPPQHAIACRAAGGPGSSVHTWNCAALRRTWHVLGRASVCFVDFYDTLLAPGRGPERGEPSQQGCGGRRVG